MPAPVRKVMMAAALCAALSACATMEPASVDGAAPVTLTALPAPNIAPEPSVESTDLARRYARLERDFRTRGLLRRDGGGPDAPFDSRILADNFMRVALFDEFVTVGDRIVARETESAVRRWSDRVEIGIVFGLSVPPEDRARDTATVEALASRLTRAARHSVTTTRGPGNMTVFIVNEDERRALGPQLQALVPGIAPSVIRTITTMPPTIFCMMIAFSGDDDPYVYRRAVGIIRAEHPPLLRESCLHEEIAQGLGLANDSPAARPSIFNDDEEFALLTRHDELLLRMLYDPRLRPGMDAATALPIVRTIADDLLPPAISTRFVPSPKES